MIFLEAPMQFPNFLFEQLTRTLHCLFSDVRCLYSYTPVHRYRHGYGSVHGSDHLVVGGLQQADVVHTIHSAAIDLDWKVGH